MSHARSSDDGGRKTRFQPAFQGIRAMAVCLVILYHLQIPFFDGGFIGVDIFFVLSGYLVSQQLIRDITRLRNKKGSTGFLLSNFYRARFWRLAPAAFITILITLIVSYSTQNYTLFRRNLVDGFYSLFSLQNWNLFFNYENYFSVDTKTLPFMHFWSLSIEEQFYLFLPLMLIVLFRVQRIRFPKNLEGVESLIRRKVIINLTFLVLFSYFYSCSVFLSGGDNGYFSSFTRFWELGSGVLLALLSPSSKKINHLRLVIGGVFLIVISILSLTSTSSFPGWQAITVVLGSMLLIYSLPELPEKNVFSKVFNSPTMQWIGDRSYSIYLIHWPLILFFRDTNLDYWKKNAIFFPTLLILASLSFSQVENRFRYTKKLPQPLDSISLKIRKIKLKYFTLVFSLIFSIALISYSSNLQKPPMLVAPSEPSSSLNLSESVANSPKVRISERSVNLKWEEKLSNSLDVKSLKGVEPRLGELLASRDELWNTCMKEPELGAPSCVFGGGAGGLKIAVVGDSLARNYAEMLRASATFSGARFELYIFAGCPLTFFSNLQRKDSDYLECHSKLTKEFKYLMKKKYSLLFLASSDDNTYVDKGMNLSVQSHLVNSISEIESMAPEIVFLGMPSKQRGLIDCVTTKEEISKNCFSKSSDYQRIQTAELNAIRVFGGSFWNPNVALCSRGLCPPVIDGLAVFYDGEHLTLEMATRLGPVFDDWYSKVSP